MKLIIDVDEDFYKKCTNYVTVDKFFPTIHQVDTALSSIGNGVPFDIKKWEYDMQSALAHMEERENADYY